MLALVCGICTTPPIQINEKRKRGEQRLYLATKVEHYHAWPAIEGMVMKVERRKVTLLYRNGELLVVGAAAIVVID